MTTATAEAPPPMEPTCDRDHPCDDCATRDTNFDGAPRCTAWSTQRHHRCERARTPGTTVCASHGSRAPQVRRKARLRLLELIDPAIATLAREMTNTTATSADRQRAANSILDRAGMPRRSEVDHGAAQALLAERIRATLEARRTSTEQLPAGDTGGPVYDAEIVGDGDERMEA